MCLQKGDPAARQVSPAEAQAVAERYGAKYVETSAFSGEHVEAAFTTVVREVWGNKPVPPPARRSWFRCAIL